MVGIYTAIAHTKPELLVPYIPSILSLYVAVDVDVDVDVSVV